SADAFGEAVNACPVIVIVPSRMLPTFWPAANVTVPGPTQEPPPVTCSQPCATGCVPGASSLDGHTDAPRATAGRNDNAWGRQDTLATGSPGSGAVAATTTTSGAEARLHRSNQWQLRSRYA